MPPELSEVFMYKNTRVAYFAQNTSKAYRERELLMNYRANLAKQIILPAPGARRYHDDATTSDACGERSIHVLF